MMWKVYVTIGVRFSMVAVTLFILSGCGNSNPTSVPTNLPTINPTPAPITNNPTIAPTSIPSFAPTSSPTTARTSSPTSIPTSAPTTRSTIAPTSIPIGTTTNLVEKAIDKLVDMIKRDNPYAPFIALNCISFIYNDSGDASKVGVDIREKHGNGCPGDPQTAPILDRFIVYLNSDRILWYDVITDTELPYSQFLASRQAKK